MEGSSDGKAESVFRPIEEFLNELATAEDLPDLAVAACVLRFPESGPALRAVLARAADGEALTLDEQTLLFRGLYILGGRRDPQAFASLLRLLRRPSEEVEELMGIAITESLARIVAGVFDGNAEMLLAAAADPARDEFVRDALIGAAAFLTWEGQIERERMERFLRHFYDERLAEDGSYAWVAWQGAVALLALRPLVPLVDAAWEEGRVPPDLAERSDFEAVLASAEREPDDLKRFGDVNLGYVDDVLEALQRVYRLVEPRDASVEEEHLVPGIPAINPWRHVGRNDPCPCGSGKKAKRCCLVR